jgi:hypothetical protein
MNWKLIALLSIFGLAMGLLTISIIPSNIEPFFWIAIMLISAYVIARYAQGKYFLHGFLVSIANSIWITIAHAAFFYQYIDTHPEYIQMTNGLPETLAGHPRRMMVVIGPLTGVFFGLIQGLFAWIASRFVKGLR